ASIDDYEQCEPIYIEMDGFDEPLTEVKTYKDLPKNAKKYLEKISELTGVEIGIVSVGPDRTQTIIKTPFFE
ncbi:MAG: adenylosuccinate synthetase, partial [Candidatus Izemoplasmataceae bacterium]